MQCAICCTCTHTNTRTHSAHSIDMLTHSQLASQSASQWVWGWLNQFAMIVICTHRIHTKYISEIICVSVCLCLCLSSPSVYGCTHICGAWNFRIDFVTSPSDLCACHTKWCDCCCYCCSILYSRCILTVRCILHVAQLCPFGMHSIWRYILNTINRTEKLYSTIQRISASLSVFLVQCHF